MANLVWSEQYNCHSCRVGRFTLNVNWTSGGYQVSFGRYATLKNVIPDLAEAKTAGVRLARKVLTEALTALDQESADGE